MSDQEDTSSSDLSLNRSLNTSLASLVCFAKSQPSDTPQTNGHARNSHGSSHNKDISASKPKRRAGGKDIAASAGLAKNASWASLEQAAGTPNGTEHDNGGCSEEHSHPKQSRSERTRWKLSKSIDCESSAGPKEKFHKLANRSSYYECETAPSREPKSTSSSLYAAKCGGDTGGGKVANSAEKPKRKLVLHFDIRNTILVADSITSESVEQALNTFLTGVTWGAQVTGDASDWLWYSERPSLAPPPGSGAMTYYKLLEKSLVRQPSDRALLRQATGDFTLQPIGAKFRPYFDKHLKLLEWTHSGMDDPGSEADPRSNADPDDPRSNADPDDPKLTITGREGHQYHYILPSFLRMIYNLHDAGREFSIVIRTYGMDATNVLAVTKKSLSGRHPAFNRRLPIEVKGVPGRIRRSLDGKISLEVSENEALASVDGRMNSGRIEPAGGCSNNLQVSDVRRDGVINVARGSQICSIIPPVITNGRSIPNKPIMHSATACDSSLSINQTVPRSSPGAMTSLDDEREIYKHLGRSEGVTGYVDDFIHWQNDGYHHRSGKPLWVDLGDHTVQHILFDDNIRVADVDSIADVRLFEESRTFRNVPECSTSGMFRNIPECSMGETFRNILKCSASGTFRSISECMMGGMFCCIPESSKSGTFRNIPVCSTDETFRNIPECSTGGKFRSLSREELARFENACLVQADLLDATGNEEYFSDKVKLCEANYDRLLEESNVICSGNVC